LNFPQYGLSTSLVEPFDHSALFHGFLQFCATLCLGLPESHNLGVFFISQARQMALILIVSSNLGRAHPALCGLTGPFKHTASFGFEMVPLCLGPASQPVGGGKAFGSLFFLPLAHAYKGRELS